MEHLLKKYDPTYHGSKLNHFVAENCKKTMVVNNIDMVIYDYENKIITFVESKYNNEPVRKGQQNMLNKLRKLLPKNIDNWLTRVLIIRGDPPYNAVVLESIDGLYKKKLNKAELIKFINGETR